MDHNWLNQLTTLSEDWIIYIEKTNKRVLLSILTYYMLYKYRSPEMYNVGKKNEKNVVILMGEKRNKEKKIFFCQK